MKKNTVRWSFTLALSPEELEIFTRIMAYLKRKHFSHSRADALRYVVGCGREQALKEISDDDGEAQQQHT